MVSSFFLLLSLIFCPDYISTAPEELLQEITLSGSNIILQNEANYFYLIQPI